MSKKFKAGPAKCRNPVYEAEILEIDMNIEPDRNLLVRYRKKGTNKWFASVYWDNGLSSSFTSYKNDWDLLPPKLTEEEIVDFCMDKFKDFHYVNKNIIKDMVEYVIMVYKENRE